MPEYAKMLLSFLGGLALGYFGHWLKIRGERASRRRKFRDVLRVRLVELESVEDPKLAAWHNKSIQPLREEAATIREDFGRKRLPDFDRTLSMYCDLTVTEIENPDGQHLSAVLFDQPVKPGAKLFDWAKGRSRLVGLLKVLANLSR